MEWTLSHANTIYSVRSGKQVKLYVGKNTQNLTHTRSMIVDSWITRRKSRESKTLEASFNIFNCKPTNILANFWNGWCRCFSWRTPWFVNTLIQWINFNLFFRLSVRHVGLMDTEVQLLNSLVRLAGQVRVDTWRVIRELSAIFTVQFNRILKVETRSKMPYILFISSPCQNRRIPECSWQNRRMLGIYSPCKNCRMSGAHYPVRATSIQCLWNGAFTSRFIFRSALPASDQTFSFLLDSLKSLLGHCKGARKTYKACIQSKELAHWEMYQRYAAASLAHAESAHKTHGIVGRPV